MTDLILKIDGIKDALSVEFYIEREKSIKIDKEDFIKVFRNNAVEYYLPVDANYLGRGHLMAAVEFEDREPMYPGGRRRVVVSGFTGYTIPCMGEGNTISCGGYEITFKKEKDIPQNEGTKIYIGATERVVGYEYITEKMIKNLTSYEVKAMELPLLAEAGERFVVAIPFDREMKAYKDNGFGGKVPFRENPMGANGNIEVEVDGVRYKIYGEFFTTTGNTKIYIE